MQGDTVAFMIDFRYIAVFDVSRFISHLQIKNPASLSSYGIDRVTAAYQRFDFRDLVKSGGRFYWCIFLSYNGKSII